MMKKGVHVCLWWHDDDGNGNPGWAEVAYAGQNNAGEYRFVSISYGWEYLVSSDLETVTAPDGKTYQADKEKAWYHNMT